MPLNEKLDAIRTGLSSIHCIIPMLSLPFLETKYACINFMLSLYVSIEPNLYSSLSCYLSKDLCGNYLRYKNELSGQFSENSNFRVVYFCGVSIWNWPLKRPGKVRYHFQGWLKHYFTWTKLYSVQWMRSSKCLQPYPFKISQCWDFFLKKLFSLLLLLFLFLMIRELNSLCFQWNNNLWRSFVTCKLYFGISVRIS